MIDEQAALLALRARLLTVSGLPTSRGYDNVSPIPAPTAGVPFITEEFSPSTHELQTLAASNGRAEETGEYYVTVYGVTGQGGAVIRALTSAIKAAFAPGTVIDVGSDALSVRWSPAPKASQILPAANHPGFSYSQVTINWVARTRNTVLA